MSYEEDARKAKELLKALPTKWPGRKSVLTLKEANFNWKQMEWWAFYFEWLCYKALDGEFTRPGDKFGSTTTSCFDLKRSINWDLKAKAIKSDDHRSILNDKEAMDRSIKKYGVHGLIIGLCDVEYNDEKRTFQRWHERLKGGKSRYQKEREKRTCISRYRKTSAELKEILLLGVNRDNVNLLGIFKQGRNSNGTARPEKYMLEYDENILEQFLIGRIVF